ncbi:phosphoribosylformylglycinamidine synthase subunit PurL [Geofilum sp. OHC36d9]|uniref:phosphoribosylformylglycinamidine synthase subunit PurL n=1 Tax=Geofilum sp. OHC36d9 TaxID=3458413 RepID=UPI0040347175
MTNPETTIYDAESFNLTSKEFEQIQNILGRLPNRVELEFFSILWSEHASYKNSSHWLEILPRSGNDVVVEAGKESAGAVDIGDGLVCVFKVESHNHPCAIQPRLGASTGLRVVARDVFTMGAKPKAFLNSLRFGNGQRDTARWLFEEVVNGIADFEKGFGVPVVGGETFFHDGFNSAPVVNNMVVGVAKRSNLVSAVARGAGNMVAVIGVPTGVEGVEGDAFEMDFYADKMTKIAPVGYLQNVEVEKTLYKIIGTLIEQKLVIGIQGVGAQGMVGAVVEMARRGKAGVRVRTSDIPVVDKELSPRDILVSETWGRILVCLEPSAIDKVKTLVEEKALSFGILGEVTNDQLFTLVENQATMAQMSVDYLGFGGKTPVYEPVFETAKGNLISYTSDKIQEPDHYPAVVKTMMSSLNLVSKKWISRKYSASLGSQDLSTKYPSDASLIEIESGGKALTATLDGNPEYMTGNPFIGAQIAVAEAARNIICAGGKPLAVSDCLNFGNPNDPKAFGDFVAAVKGVAKACQFFDVPVVSGNVSFYNQQSEDGVIVPIIPSPIIGMVGLLKDARRHTTLPFRHKGDMIFMIGQSREDFNGSEYIRKVHGVKSSLPPFYDAEEEKDLHSVVAGVIDAQLARSVHDVSNGGVFFTLFECAEPLGFGFDITTDAEIRKDAFLFGESQSRVVVSVAPEKQDLFVDYMVASAFPFSILGHVTKSEIRIDDESFGFIEDLKKIFDNGLKHWVDATV